MIVVDFLRPLTGSITKEMRPCIFACLSIWIKAQPTFIPYDVYCSCSRQQILLGTAFYCGSVPCPAAALPVARTDLLGLLLLVCILLCYRRGRSRVLSLLLLIARPLISHTYEMYPVLFPEYEQS